MLRADMFGAGKLVNVHRNLDTTELPNVQV